ncbi:sporulation protein YlmC with PRC-barrel domain [Pseudarthrobacter defluvii]|uniref:PRC-barrel domain-containing protein n=1 Tax=Pseudarthrobacter defluvii TaxID=410837 RepID=UPI00278226FA|nr:PRC-barrel domain-containing protein [Pseudarthrobacter defluvii]MDQ0768000.1 sporulation protein YlmC with PRC-barrel domain [Pseudarthrobacter defluvii]
MGNNASRELVKLGDTGKTVADITEDIRGYTARDGSGAELGKVEELLIDPGEEKVRFLIIASGGFLGMGKDKAFLPVDTVKSINHSDHEVLIDQAREHIAGAPEYDPDLEEAISYYETVYGYYGFSPYWSPGYTYPALPYHPR